MTLDTCLFHMWERTYHSQNVCMC